MKKAKTYYIKESSIDLMEELKERKGLATYGDVIDYLLENESLINNSDTNKENDTVKLNQLLKQSDILLEMMTCHLDLSEHHPSLSYQDGFSEAYNGAKALVEKNIEKQSKLKQEQDMFKF